MQIWLLAIVALVVLAIKGFALWEAARRNDLAWFIALLLLNTLGILELVYLFVFAKDSEEKIVVIRERGKDR